MAKKIRLDFSKVEERSGINTKKMPEGLHAFKIVAVEDKEAGDGTDMYVFYLVPEVEKYKTRRFPYYTKLQQNQFWKLRDLMVAAGVLDAAKSKGKAVNIDPNKAIGKVVAGEVEDETGQYEGRSSLANIYGLDILDDDSTGVDDEDEDEYDEEAEEADDEYEDDADEEEEADEDELREEIEALTLPALRKRAKGLGIDTDGVKKAELVELVIEEELGEGEDEDDEDDLDDEDLEDEELEDEEFEDDEEEEEEPAPKRRAARKAPAKAPARRTVKRR